MQSAAKSVDEYLASLPPDRRGAITTVRDLVLANLPRGYVEVMQYGMISWVVPPEQYPHTYNGQPLAVAALAAQKNYLSLYLMAVYGNRKIEEWFREEYRRSGQKLQMGKSCLRFRSAGDIPLDLIGRTIARVGVEELVALHERARGARVHGAADTEER